MTARTVFNQRGRILFLWVAAPLLVFLIAVTAPGIDDASFVTELLETLGVFAVVVCIAGRCWSVLFIGDRKNQVLVQNGPYAVMRNPLYFFSAVGMFGIGLMAESVTLALLLGAFTYAVFRHVSKREEADLRAMFGEEFERYCAHVPRFLPKLSAMSSWRVTEESIMVSPRVLMRTFVDALVFLLAFPAVELLDYLHETGAVAVLLRLY